MNLHRISEQTKGVFVISATPFAEDGGIDFASIDSLVEYYLGHGVHGITLLGMMGEANKLTGEESIAVVRHALKRVGGRVPVVVGISNPALKAMCELAHDAMAHGAAGMLVAPITGLRTDDQILGYLGAACDALGPTVPCIYQDYPPTTNVYLSATLFARMVAAFPQVAGLKMEDNPGLDKLTRIRDSETRGETRRVGITVGNGGLFLPQSLARGADGVMTGFGYPEMLVQVYERYTAGDVDAADDLYDMYLPLVCYEQQPGFGLAVRKEILRRRGAIRSAAVRAPGPTLTNTDRAELDRIIMRLERRLGERAND
jgi:4-hydroxy-tetrahydrodipicolinate synthase